jgi:hypothetical protein
MENLGDGMITEQFYQIGRRRLTPVDLDHIRRTVARRYLHDTEPVTMRIEPERFRIDSDGINLIMLKVWQIIAVKADSHRRFLSLLFSFVAIPDGKPLHTCPGIANASRMRAQER